LLLLFSVYIFGFAFYAYLKKNSLETVFPPIVKINFVLFIIALLTYSTKYKELLWTIRNLTVNIRDFQRLELFTYEPSYYSLLLAPIAIYYFLKFFLTPTSWKTLITYTLAILLPLLFSFSLGVILGLIFSFAVFLTFYFFKLIKYKKVFYTLLTTSLLLTTALFALLIFYPENPLFERILDVTNGKDTSASGRTVNAISLALEIAERKSIWSGVGLGQIKVIGAEIIREFYNYDIADLASIRIPNAIGETIAMFGISGLFFRLLIQLYLFFKTKVYSNYYRFTVFTFIFIYQFSGSFFQNSAEVVMWVIAFSSGFSIFTVRNLRPR
jgi:hypothetical protein